jgi:parallel beta-helix repeat protein
MANKILFRVAVFFFSVSLVWAQSVPLQTAKLSNVRFADQFPGATADAKIANCIADLPAAGGVCDARGIQGTQTLAGQITISKPVKLLLGAVTLSYGSVTAPFLIISSGVSIIGLGRGITTITTNQLYKMAIQGGAVPSRSPPSDVTIKGITFAGPAPASWDTRGTVGINLAGVSGWHIEDNEFTGWSHVAIGFAETVTGDRIVDCNHNLIAHNSIHDNPGEGITVFTSNAAASLNGYNIISNNQIWNNGLSGVDISTQFNTVIGNTISGNGTQSANGDSSSIQISGALANYNIIEGNQINAGNQWGLTITGSNNIITGNEISGSTGAIGRGWGTGLQIGHVGTGWIANNNVVSQNIIAMNAGYGILVCAGQGASSDANIIEGNQVLGNLWGGIYIAPGGVTNTSLMGNTVLNNKSFQIGDSGINTVSVSNRTSAASNP